jgi:hypothetical protein
MSETKRFVATSLNVCRYQIVMKDRNVAVSAHWMREPTATDLEESNVHIVSELAADGIERDALYAIQGSVLEDGQRKSIDAVEAFLKTGDPGVPTKKIKQ